jgi:hypothetical protein
MNTKHTPGPWAVGLYSWDNVKGAHGILAEGCLIPICHSIMGGDLEESDANARLIAAAPDLLEALRKAEAWVSQYHGMVGHNAASRQMSSVIFAAIAKATGGAA